MSKYYITSGKFNFVCVADNVMQACYKAKLKAINDEFPLDKYFYVSERGFRGPKDYERQNSISTDEVPDEQVDIRDVD